MTNILAIDPGWTTGLAFKTNDNYAAFQTSAPGQPGLVWNMFQVEWSWDVVIVETFQTAGLISRYGLYTTELVGGIKVLCYIHKVELVTHTPQRRIAFMKEAKAMLKSLGLPIEAGHKMDALAHLLAWEYHTSRSEINGR